MFIVSMWSMRHNRNDFLYEYVGIGWPFTMKSLSRSHGGIWSLEAIAGQKFLSLRLDRIGVVLLATDSRPVEDREGVALLTVSSRSSPRTVMPSSLDCAFRAAGYAHTPIAQASWLVIQLCGRAIRSLPTTTMELSAAAIVLCTFGTFIC